MGRELTPAALSSVERDNPAVGDDCRDRIHSEVFEWISTRLRQLPWRDERDPWKILVSEVMLQQTSVHRVLAKWELFVSEFPTPEECARAELADLLKLWQGLGYPRRARNLHSCARVIVNDFAGEVPGTVEELLSLPGIGPYTARAIVAFAFEKDAAVVDTNILRVLRRWSGERLTPRPAQALADELLPEGEAWLWNQAMMDLGATVCRPKPNCAECPVRRTCRWQGMGPDPSERSQALRQAPFEGSDRQARGRLMKALVDGPVSSHGAAEVMGRSPDTASRLVQNLLEEGLIRVSGEVLHL